MSKDKLPEKSTLEKQSQDETEKIISAIQDKTDELYNNDTANILFADGDGFIVADNLEKYSGLDYQEIIEKLFEAGEERALARNILKFPNVNHQEIANRMIRNKRGDCIIEYFDNFKGLDELTIHIAKAQADCL